MIPQILHRAVVSSVLLAGMLSVPLRGQGYAAIEPVDSVRTEAPTEPYRTPHTLIPDTETRKTLSTGLLGGMFLGSMIDSYYAWWQDTEGGFRFHDDGWFGRNMTGTDKPGHMFVSYFYFNSFYDVLRWGGHDHETAFWWSAGTTYAFALLIEIGDGLTTLGFDYQDLVFNTLGLSLGMLSKEYPVLANFKLKMSYVPYEGYDFPPRFTQHYDALTFWLAVDVDNLLPSSLEPYWPDPLQLAVGVSVKDHYTAWHPTAGRPELVFGLDLDLGGIPIRQQELHLLRNIANHYHFPMPAVKFTQGERAAPKLFYLQ